MQEQEAFDRAGYAATVLDPIQVHPAASVRRLVEFGEPVEVLRATAADANATHIVVGSRGQGAVEDILAASTSGALAREAPCPVILVPSEVDDSIGGQSDATIICGVDGSSGSVAAARHAGELAQRLGGQLVLAHVFEDEMPDRARDNVFDPARSAAPEAQIELEPLHGEVPDALLALAHSKQARLVAVGSRGRGAVKAAVLGSRSSRLVQDANLPVMVVSERSATGS